MMKTQRGKSYPLGATVMDGGVNFSVYSKSAEAMDLLLFDGLDSPRVIALENDHRTFHYWHVFVEGIGPGQRYAYRARGPMDPERGMRFDPEQVLLDPYGRAVHGCAQYDRDAAVDSQSAMKSVVVDLSTYDWEGDTPIHRPFSRTVIYEMHVGGFTKHPSSGLPAERRGTYLGLADKIGYLKDLGITAVELLPIYQFDPKEAPRGKTNYWGYNPVSFFAPHVGYATKDDPLRAIDEVRDMIKALHSAGIEVILDVVYNHTAEADDRGPTFCFRGLENKIYYHLNEDGEYANYSGCGNTLDASHSVVRRLILDSLRYWVIEMHIDGFRFDLASILSRDETGTPRANPPILWEIETDPALAGTKLIAEAWDAAGLYQVGSFIGDRWKEWNGIYRDDVRRFVKGDEGLVSKIAPRFLASPDIYQKDSREPEQSINFVTCHDGFTLNDLVSYNEKHNEGNGEENRDGTNDNRSWNCGHEGPTDDPHIEARRLRQIKNFYTITLLSLGVPMLLMGDEVRRTQQGNNNAYCQDNEIAWFDWTQVARNEGLFRFVAALIRIRLSLAVFKGSGGKTLEEYLDGAPLRWHGVKQNQPDWSSTSRSLAFEVRGRRGLFQVILNAHFEPLRFELASRSSGWLRILDTSLPTPEDLLDLDTIDPGLALKDNSYTATAHSVVVLLSPCA